MKAHIFCSTEPMRERLDRTAMCGEIVPCAVWVYHFNSEQNREFLGAISAVNTCIKCFRAPWPDGYIYGMVSAEEADAQRVEEAEVA